MWTSFFKKNIPTIFYDNEQQHIDSVSKYYQKMQCVKISEDTKPGVNYNYSAPVNEGINKLDLELLKKWIDKTSIWNSNIDVIFDWDRTLSCVEGITLDLLNPELRKVTDPEPGDVTDPEPGDVTDPDPGKVTKPDPIHYLVGGPVRFEYLRSFFAGLNSHKVNILILTNNPLAIPKKIVKDRDYVFASKVAKDTLLGEIDYRQKMVELISMLIPNFNDSQLISTHEYNNRADFYNVGDRDDNFGGNKGIALINYTESIYTKPKVIRTGKTEYEAILKTHKGGAKLNKKRSLKNRRIRNYKRKSIRLKSSGLKLIKKRKN